MVFETEKTPLAPAPQRTASADPSQAGHSESSLPSGTVLDRYEVLFELARGGMGRVYMARQVGAHEVSRLVALKQLDTRVADAEALSAFVREARIAARVSHPNVVQTHELGEQQGAPFIVMQLVQGVSLAALLARLSDLGELIDPRLAEWILAQTALGLHAAHSLTVEDGSALEVVHRDISPQNILLSYEGRPYLADFGIAKLAQGDSATASGVIKGKFSYMSPEQAQASPLDRRSDIFSLGILLYEALTGERAFVAKSPAEVVVRILHHRLPPPNALRPEVGDGLNAIVLRCLEKNPSDRFQTAADLAQALRDDLRSRGASVDEIDLAELLRRVFPGEQAALAERIRNAWIRLDEDRSGTETRGAERPLSSNRSPAFRSGIAVVAALIAVAGLFWLHPWTSAKIPGVEPPVAASRAVPPAAASSPAPTDSVSVQVAGDASSAPSASAAPAAADVPRIAVPKLPTTSEARDASAPVPPPAATGSYKGVPFNTL